MQTPMSTPRHLAPITCDITRGVLRDDQDRVITLRGLNVGGRAKRAPYLPFEIAPTASLKKVREGARWMMAQLPAWGLDVVRLPFAWAFIEPQRGRIDEGALDRLEVLCDEALVQGVRVMIDCHQDIWSAALGGDGFPDWTLPAEVRERRGGLCYGRWWFLGYLIDPDVRRAFTNLWQNEDALLDRFEAMWHAVLGRLGDHPAVCGVEILNEPYPGTLSTASFRAHVWRPLHERLAAWAEARYPHLLWLYSAPGAEFLDPSRVHAFPRHDRVVFAPHLYDPGLLMWPHAGATLDPRPALSALHRLAREAGVPVWLGEFGVSHGGEREEAARWLDRTLDVLDEGQMSATLWECSRSARRWNGEDLNVLDWRGEPRPILGCYGRPRISAMDGDMIAASRDERAMTMRYRAHGARRHLVPGRER